VSDGSRAGHGAAPPGAAPGLREHRRAAPARVPTAVLTVSDTRSVETDAGGALVAELLAAAGHPLVSRSLVRDDAEAIRGAALAALAQPEVRALIVTGGTGVAPRDVTPDALEPLFERALPGFGELFRMLSFAEIGSAALLSRACAGLRGGRVVFVLPGSRGALRLAMERLILPELGHLAGEAVKTR
jgi:molybdenum cofactor biosynthesis protein B